jgi:hypothetical protein
MTSSYSYPGLMLGGGGFGNSSGLGNPGQLQVMYQNLLSGAAATVSSLGVKTLVLTSGAIGTAGFIQIGNTETADEVAQNQAVLRKIADFCNANGIQVVVQATLTNSETYGSGPTALNALVDQWATVAASVNLPISAVQDVEEIGSSKLPSSFAAFAAIEANAVSTLIRDYANSGYKMTAANLAVGDMEGGDASTIGQIEQWWQAYNAAAAQAGVAGFSSVTTDTGWFAPWIDGESKPTWTAGLSAMSTLAASHHMAINVTIQGSAADLSADQFLAQAEQNAIELAKLAATGSIHVSNLLIQSWSALPVGVGQISSPTSSTNEAAEIQAVYPLYEQGLVSAQGGASLCAPGQLLLNTGTVTALGSLSVNWGANDIASNARLAIVLIDQTGSLAATQHGSGTVSNISENILVLSGNAADLAAELRSLTITELNPGPDTLDIEIYGNAGRLTDNSISILAANIGQFVGSIAATAAQQGWVSSASFLNHGTVITAGAVMTSETLYWNTTGTLDNSAADALGQVPFLKTVAIHEPLAQYGVKNVSSIVLGTTMDAVVDFFDPKIDNGAFPSGGFANVEPDPEHPVPRLSLSPLSGWLAACFNPAQQVTRLAVASTVNTFDANTGALETSVDSLMADPITVVDKTGTHANAFATAFDNGGTQVTEYNTGSNPNWQPGWGSQFNTVTLTYDGNGHLVEAFLRGGPSNPWFSVDYVFNPNNGKLWEIFQSTTPPAQGPGTANYVGTNNPYQPGFVTGPLYVTEFNTGDNPNWDYVDMGSALSSYTEVWTDYLVLQNFVGFAVNFPNQYAGSVNAYPYEFVNGTTLDLMYLPGAINVDLNALGSVVLNGATMASGLAGLRAIDAAWSTGTVTLTGLRTGSSTLIGGANLSVLTGFGHDTFVAGAGRTTIATGAGHSLVQVADASAVVSVAGIDNTITAVAGSVVSLLNDGNMLNGSGLTVSLATGATGLMLNGNDDIVSILGTGTVSVAGTGDVLNFSNGGTCSVLGAGSSIRVFANHATLYAQAGQSVSITGQANTVIGSNATIYAGLNTSLTLTGTNSIVSLAAPASSPPSVAAISGGAQRPRATANAGRSGEVVLEVTNAGTVALNAANRNVTVQLNAATNLLLTAGLASASMVSGSNDNDVFTVSAQALVAGSRFDGRGGQNTLILAGGGAFNLGAPSQLTNIGTVVASSAGGTQGQSIYLRNNASVTVNIADSDVASVYGASDDAIINLGKRTGCVVVGSARETINGGGGATRYYVTATTIGATITGRGPWNALMVRDGGNVTMGANISQMQLVSLLDGAGGYHFTANGTAGLTIISGGSSNVVTIGAASQRIIGGAGALRILAIAANAGAAITSGAGPTTLEITSGGTAALNVADTNMNVVLDASATLRLSRMAFITATGAAAGHNTIIAGARGQTLQSIGGNDTLVGFAGFGDVFRGTTTGLNGDIIQNFGGDDVIDITDLNFASLQPLSYVALTRLLTASDGVHCTQITLSSGVNASSLRTAADGHGGTFISLTSH